MSAHKIRSACQPFLIIVRGRTLVLRANAKKIFLTDWPLRWLALYGYLRQEIKWKNTELMTSWNNIKIYLMLCVKQTWLCVFCVFLFSAWFSKRNSCVGLVRCWRGNLDLLKWAEFSSCWLNHEKRLKSWKKIEILKSWEPTWEPIPKSWNKIEILKQDWNPETRSVQKKQKLLHLCSTTTSLHAPAWPPFFALKIAITTDLAAYLRIRLWLLFL